MKRVILFLLTSIFAFSCTTKKIIYSKQSQPEVNTVEIKVDGTNKAETPKVQAEVVVKKEEVDVPVKKQYSDENLIYIDDYKAIAKEEMFIYKIPASITLAQGILESSSGKGRLSVEANNHFGIKCHDWTGDRIYHDDDASQECFRKYEHASMSYRDHSLFLKNRSRYSKLFDLKIEDYKAWARELKAAGYATDVKYPNKIIDLIERYNLYEYDKEVLGSSYVMPETVEEVKEVDTVVVKNELPQEVKSDTLRVEKSERYEDVKAETLEQTNTSGYIVSKGDTLYSISKKFNLTVEQLKQLNGLIDNTISIGQNLKVLP